MNLFKKLFRTQTSKVEAANSALTSSEVVQEDVFVDQHAPAMFPSAEAAIKNPVSAFLDINYTEDGYRDGYTYHSGDMLTNRIKSMMSEFRNCVDKQLEKVHIESQKMREHRIEIDGLSGRMVKRIDLAIEGFTQVINQLNEEKEKSAAEEGLVMKSVNEYREGFIRGMEDYQVEKLLCGDIGLFN